MNKNTCSLLNGLHTSNTANMLTYPINRYIIVVNGPCAIPNVGPNSVNSIMLNIMTSANGIAFRITFIRNVPVTFLLFGSNDMKNEVYASITRSINVICIGKNGNAVFVIIQNIDSNIEYIVFMKNILAVFVRLFTTLLPSINMSFNTLKSGFSNTICDTCFAASFASGNVMLQSASLSAITSFTPSPVIATLCPFACNAFTNMLF